MASPTPGSTPDPGAEPGQALAAVRTMTVGARVTVTAVVTAEPGRLGTPALIAVGDDTGGIAVRLPRGIDGFARGTLLRVTGTLAAPYGQLEIRAATDGIQAIGDGMVPVPLAASPAGLDEAVEGRLVMVTGTISAKPKGSAGGDLTIVLERPGAASIKVVADGSSRLASQAFSVGATYRLVGVVGQRATRKGALDGYRLCPRDSADVIALVGAGGDPSVPGGSGGSGGSSGSNGPGGSTPSPAIPIARALGLIDQSVTIEGIVTAPATLLDATGRRIVIQDGSAAIELLLPTGVDAPAVGTRVRAVGRIGRAYGAPRLRADALTILGSGPVPAPLSLRRAPGLAQEWRLVTITGRLDKVRKLGDRWRAEMLVAANRVVVVGQPGSGIAVTALVEGRMATVTGIVRRPYPTASDQRYAITPRTPADLRVLGAHAPSAGRGTVSGNRPTSTAGTTRPTAGPSSAGVVDADLIDLAAFGGQLVRVGGLVVDLRPDGLLVDDGTSVGLVILHGAALAVLPLLEPEDAINATGRVETVADGPAVVIDDPGGIVQAGDPVASVTDPVKTDNGPAARPEPGESSGPETEHSSTQRAGLLDGLPVVGAGLAGLGTLVALSLVSLAIGLVRRAHARGRLEERVAARLAAFGVAQSPPSTSRSPERDGSTFHSA